MSSPAAGALRHDVVRHSALVTLGLLIGGVSSFVELAFILIALPACLFPAGRRWAFTMSRHLAEFERRRLDHFLRCAVTEDYPDERALRYLCARWLPGGLGAGIFLLMLWGVVSAGVIGWNLLSGKDTGGDDPLSWYDPPVVALFGILLVFLAVQGLAGIAAFERRLVKAFLGPSREDLLRRRVSQLATTRADVVDAINDERRRIERDLHDGVQQRLVALGMLLGRARRTDDPHRSAELLRQAHGESQEALRDLRDVTWRVYPVALDESGLADALESLAERSVLPVSLDHDLRGRLGGATETVLYFVASEAVNNAVKHAGATGVELTVRHDPAQVSVRITDDGRGGADPAGSGLSGLARRVAAADGRFTVRSPAGGPTVIAAELPCA